MSQPDYTPQDHWEAWANKTAPQPQPMPPWMTYDFTTDVLTIHGKRYSAAMFGEDGFLAPPGTVLRIEQGPPDVVTVTTVQPHPKQEPVAVWVRPNGINNSGVAHFGETCPPGWVGAAAPYYASPQPQPDDTALLKQAYLAGFMVSAEGFNGEYPFDYNEAEAEGDEYWVEVREYVIAELKEQLK